MSRFRLLSLFFLAGAFSQVVQAIMGREMLVVFYGNEICLGVFFASWLFWIALGAWGSGRLSERLKRPETLLWSLLALLPVAAGGGIMLLRVCRRFMDVSAGQLVSFDQLAIWGLVVTLPVGMIVGAVFPLACRTLGREREVSSVYIWDALGGLAGGALFTFLLVDKLPLWRILGLLNAALGIMLLPASIVKGDRLMTRRVIGGAWATLGLFLLLTPLGRMTSDRADRIRWASLLPDLDLVESFDTPYQNVAIARHGAQTSVVADGRVVSSFPEEVVPAMEAALLYAQNPRAKRILLVEGATVGLLPEFLKYPAESIVDIESDSKAFRRISSYLPRDWQEALTNKRIIIKFDDPRRALSRSEHQRHRFDLVVCLIQDPSTAQINRLYTKEFFLQVRGLLAPGGVFVANLTSAENYLGAVVGSYNASVYATMAEVFEDVRVTPGDINYLLASNAKGVLTLDYRELARRYRGVEVRGRSFDPDAFSSLVPRDRVKFIEQTLRKANGELNTDLRPVTYYLNMLLWGSFSGSEWVGALDLVRRAGEWIILFPLLMFVLARMGYGLTEADHGREGRFAAVLATCSIGFLAMVLEITLLFVFQSFHGHIYSKIGLLNGLFMFGLAIGAIIVASFGLDRSERPGIWVIAVAIAATIYAFCL
ncbi:spermidine synthase, partial [Elusimicrobiota bacterium]